MVGFDIEHLLSELAGENKVKHHEFYESLSPDLNIRLAAYRFIEKY